MIIERRCKDVFERKTHNRLRFLSRQALACILSNVGPDFSANALCNGTIFLHKLSSESQVLTTSELDKLFVAGGKNKRAKMID
uniref:Uncharacterized protein n=1 Tax=Anguilla anguilla TaxID=7936 RepID=A0A0E9XR60_ANGAN